MRDYRAKRREIRADLSPVERNKLSEMIPLPTPDAETQRATEKGRFLVYKVLARVAQISREKVNCMRMTLNIPPDFL